MLDIQERFKCHGVKLPEKRVKQYTILSTKDIIEKEIGELVKQCMEIFEEGVSIEDCQMMLYDFNWHCNELLEKFSEAESLKDFLEKNKIDLTIPLPADEMVNSFVQSNSLFKWCPNKFKKCKNVIKIESSDVVEIVCDCGFPFCYKCDNIPHSSFPCILLTEWVKQCEEYEFIFEHNNVICPHCYEVYDVDTWDLDDTVLTCTHCDDVFVSEDNKLKRPGVFPEYDYYYLLSARLDKITLLNMSLKECGSLQFLATVTQIVQNILYQVLPLPLFSFFLDKKYLSQNPTTAENVSTFEFFKNELERMLSVLMFNVVDLSNRYNYNPLFFKEDEDRILRMLHRIQTYLDKFLKFINETHGWIFKLPEIQQIYDFAYYDGIENEGDDVEVTADLDIDADDDMNADELSDDNDMHVNEDSSEVEEEYADDGMGNTYVLA